MNHHLSGESCDTIKPNPLGHLTGHWSGTISEWLASPQSSLKLKAPGTLFGLVTGLYESLQGFATLLTISAKSTTLWNSCCSG